MEMNKKGANNSFIGLVVIVAVIFLVSQGTFGGTTSQPPSQVQQAPGGTFTACDASQGATMTAGPLTNKWQASTSVEPEHIDYYIGGLRQTIIKNGATKNVPIGAKIDLINAANSSRYYASKQSLVAPCGTFDSANPAYDPLGRAQLIQNTTFTQRVFNIDNRNQNAAADNESITQGEAGTFEIILEGLPNEGWSPYSGIDAESTGWVQTCEMNRTDFVESDTELTVNDVKASRTSNPTAHPTPGTDMIALSWKIPQGCGTASSAACKYTEGLFVQAEDTQNPGADTGANLNSINCSFYDEDYERHPDDPKVHIFAIEDQDGNITGQAADVDRQILQLLYR